MVTEAPSTVRARRLRERRSRGVAMVAPVEVGEGGEPCVVFSVVAGGSPAVVATKECPQAAAVPVINMPPQRRAGH